MNTSSVAGFAGVVREQGLRYIGSVLALGAGWLAGLLSLVGCNNSGAGY